MPKFDVTLVHTVIQNTVIEVSAKDEEAAQVKAEQAIQDLLEPDAIAKKFKSDWEIEEENIEVESVDEQ